MRFPLALMLVAITAHGATVEQRIDALTAGKARLDASSDAPALWAFLVKAEETDERVGWAQLHLGRALLALGYSHAAAVFFSRIANERTNPAAVAPAVEELKALLARPHDEALVEEGIFGALELSSLPESTRQLANYQQGFTDLKAGRERWAHSHFEAIPSDSPEWARARFAVLVTQLKGSRIAGDGLIKGFEALANHKVTPDDVRLESQLAVARLHYERHEYEPALAAYRAVKLPPLDPGRAALYLEEAWARFQQGELETAMGLLVTLDAPAFRDEFLPDKYLLRAEIFRERCHWLPARRAARELLRRYATTLEAVKERRELESDGRLTRAALSKGAPKRAEAHLRQVSHEADQLAADRGVLGAALAGHLEGLYGVAVAEATRVRDARLGKALQREADRLLDAAEQVRLLEYEVGLELFARAKQAGKKPLPEDDALGPEDVGYNFSGEYWNDELKNLKVTLENRCEESSR